VYVAYLKTLPQDEYGNIPAEAKKNADTELGVASWRTPLTVVREDKPRVTEDGLTIPDWWRDDEAESQQMLVAMGME
jgi:hypothetical protein